MIDWDLAADLPSTRLRQEPSRQICLSPNPGVATHIDKRFLDESDLPAYGKQKAEIQVIHLKSSAELQNAYKPRVHFAQQALRGQDTT